MKADIVIFGAGIAGCWMHNLLSARGYNVLLLEKNKIGGAQSVGSQGIVHSGLKFLFGGQTSELSETISVMPDRWKAALRGDDEVDIRAAEVTCETQYLYIPGGLMGGFLKLLTKRTMAGNAQDLPKDNWPEPIKKAGFKGRVVYMDEPVINVPSLMKALCDPYKDNVRHFDEASFVKNADGKIEKAIIDGHEIEADEFIFTAADGNIEYARENGHGDGLETQHRPLLMGMMKNAPFPLFGHCVSPSFRPAVSITSHLDKDGKWVWYMGASVAEFTKEEDPNTVYDLARKAIKEYLPKVDLSDVEWGVYPVDRIEIKTRTGWIPDMPTIHNVDNAFYCWPTKLTFAPVLGDMLSERLTANPSGTTTDWSALQEAEYQPAPWDNAQWTPENSDKQV